MKAFLTLQPKLFLLRISLFIFAATSLLPSVLHAHHNRLELDGLVTELTDSTLSVDGLLLFINQYTEIRDNNGNLILLSDLMIGDFVETKADVQIDGSFITTEIRRDDNGEEHESKLEIRALIDGIDNNSLTVSGVQIFVDEETEIKMHGDEFLFEDLNAGDSVEVKAEFIPGEYFLAERIKLETEDPIEEDLETEGFITELGDSSLVVNGLTFFVDENTVIRDHDITISFDDLNVGDFVEVKAIFLPDSSLLAIEIKLEDRNENEIEFTGTIEAIDTSSLIVSGIPVNVNDETEILDDDNNPINFDELMVGMFVEVKALLMPDSTLLAVRIKIEDENEQQIQITAPIDTIFSSNIIVGGITFETDSNTVILDDDNNSISFEELEIGMIVEVKGRLLLSGNYYAIRIKVEDLWHSSTDISGTLNSIVPGNGRIANNEFTITSNTLLLDEFGNTVDESYLTVGMMITVRTKLNELNIEEAVRLKVKHPDEIKLNGIISNISAGSITIGNQIIDLQEFTFITHQNGKQINAEDLREGFIVNSQILSLPNQIGKAVSIKITRSPNIIKTTGTVIEKSDEYIVVAQPLFQIDISTVILNSEYRLTNYSSINIGDVVTVWADNSTAANQLALQIRKENNTVTNIDGVANGLITDYTLSQNFPNPFNPSTTIRFTLPEKTFVSLKVFNILGEEIAVLVNNNLAEGVYNINFDASHLPSGIYLYRIEVNNFSQVNKMLLVK